LAVPNSRILLHAHDGTHRREVIDYFEQAGVSSARIEFVRNQPWESYIATYQRIDIALDPFPYAGGVTSLDGLWMGVPLVSLSGRTAVGRGGRSILYNLGLGDLVAFEEEQYLRLAVALAGDIPRLCQLRDSMRQRMEQSPLMDASRFALNIEAAYRQMWRTWCAAGH
jgi:predicted O-linked N-acetylglucosamine transferase (SPINDLY family)